jgi:hypothetical protein
MRTLLRTLLVGTVLAMVGPAVALAAAPADPVLGTWKLNLAKSTFSPGPAPKSQVRTYTQTAEGIALAWTAVGADGKESVVKVTFKADGQDYPVTGSPDFDAIALKRVDAFTVESTQKKGGKTVGTTVRTVSKDGEVLTLASKGTSANGVAFANTAVFDKQ